MKRKVVFGGGAAVAAAIVAAAGIGLTVSAQTARAQVPSYQVVPLWPQPLPNAWIFGSITGLSVDGQNNIWVVHRGADSLGNNEKGMMLTPPTSSSCCVAAPFVLKFDQAGKVIGSWGGPGAGYTWPQNPAAVTVDGKGNVWIAAAGVDRPAPSGRGRGGTGRGGAPQAAPPPEDAHVLKFTSDGKFLLQIGTAGTMEGPDSQTTLYRPSGLAVDTAANEVYVADTGHGRIVVFDADKGTYKRHWGGTGDKTGGNAPGEYSPASPLPKHFRRPSCVKISADGQVYVCDRENNRIQVFGKDGSFVREGVISKETLGGTAPEGFRSYGSVWDLAFANDPQQQYIFVANGHDKRVEIVRRDSLQKVGSFGAGGRQPGLMLAPGRIAVDGGGNVYTGEDNEGKRVQKWVRQ